MQAVSLQDVSQLEIALIIGFSIWALFFQLREIDNNLPNILKYMEKRIGEPQ